MRKDQPSTTHSGMDHRQLRAINERRLMRLLQWRGALTRKELVAGTDLDPKSITNILRDLELREIVHFIGRKKSDRGRSVKMVELRRDRNLALGIHVHHDGILAVAVNPQGEVLWQSQRTGYPPRWNNIKTSLEEICRTLFSLPAFSSRYFRGIGISAPGVLDRERTTWLISNQMPELVKRKPADGLRTLTGLDVELDDDSRAKALCERFWGWGRDRQNFMLIDLDRGIGSGIFFEGKLYYGDTGRSGELGRYRLSCTGPLIEEGETPRQLEDIASVLAIPRLYHDGSLGEPMMDFEQILARAKAGDRRAVQLFERVGRLIGTALAAVHDMLDLPLCLSGHLMQAGDLIVNPLQESFHENVLTKRAHIGLSHFDARSAALGAAALIHYAYYEGRS